MRNTEEDKLEIEAGKRIIRWVRKITQKEEKLIEKMLWKKRVKENEKERNEIEKNGIEGMKRQFIERIGWSGQEWNKKVHNKQKEKIEEESK